MIQHLDKDELNFIDNYLRNSGFDYLDVRLELIDHVASAIEKSMEEHDLEFYDAFKSYMVVNKKGLERNYELFKKRLQKTSFLVLGKEIITPKFLIFFCVAVTVIYMWNKFSTDPFPYAQSVWIAIISAGLVYFFGTLPKKRYRISSLEMLAWPLVASSYAMNLYFNLWVDDSYFLLKWPLVANILTAFLITAIAAFLRLFFLKRKQTNTLLAKT
ncbi:hypothetical protein [Croceivirga radicis]|nr:hypothetical protein [Croceivirga radicis]